MNTDIKPLNKDEIIEDWLSHVSNRKRLPCFILTQESYNIVKSLCGVYMYGSEEDVLYMGDGYFRVKIAPPIEHTDQQIENMNTQ